MDLQAVIAEADVLQAALHDLQGGRLLRDEQHGAPCARHWAIMLPIVWLLPVPGGPNNTKSLPPAAARTAESWEESAESGANTVSGGCSRSRRAGSGNGVPSP